MYPDYASPYRTEDYVAPLVELLSLGETDLVIRKLWFSMPNTSSAYARVMNLRGQYLQAERNELDGLGSAAETHRRIGLAINNVLGQLLEQYPVHIPLRQDPALIGYGGLNQLKDYYEDTEDIDYELEAPYEPTRPAGRSGWLIGGTLLCLVVFGLVRLFIGSGVFNGSDTDYVTSGSIGWVILLKEGLDCDKLERQYAYTARWHDTETVVSSSGECALVIRFSSKASAERRMRQSKTLKPKFPEMRVVEL